MATSLDDIQNISTPFTGETLAIAKPRTMDLDSMTVEQLLELRQEIDNRLPEMSLAAMNLEEELVIQFRTVKALQNQVNDGEVPANQKAQVANTLSSTLDRLSKMQKELYSNERFKQIEYALIRLLKSWPTEQTQKFFDEYTEITKKF